MSGRVAMLTVRGTRNITLGWYNIIAEIKIATVKVRVGMTSLCSTEFGFRR
jgi:hypothetical protein